MTGGRFTLDENGFEAPGHRSYVPRGLRDLVGRGTEWVPLAPQAENPLVWESPTFQFLFRPRGLLVVNAPPGFFLRKWTSGMDLLRQLGPIDLEVFSFVERLEATSLQAVRCRMTFPTITPGAVLHLTVSNAAEWPLLPPASLTVWGDTAY